jgi:Domain of unknown function (DUF4183)
MSLKIIRLAITSQPKVSTLPTVTRLFHELPMDIVEKTVHKIGTTDFADDSGEIVNALPALNMNNSFFNVYINGLLQMHDNFAYTSGDEGVGSLIISVPEGSEIPQGSPIILEIVNFNPEINFN